VRRQINDAKRDAKSVCVICVIFASCSISYLTNKLTLMTQMTQIPLLFLSFPEGGKEKKEREKGWVEKGREICVICVMRHFQPDPFLRGRPNGSATGWMSHRK
jgi:hypothetical protein